MIDDKNWNYILNWDVRRKAEYELKYQYITRRSWPVRRDSMDHGLSAPAARRSSSKL